MLLVDQYIAIPRLTISQVNHSLIRLAQRSLLNPRLNVLIHSQLQHLIDQVGGSDAAAGQLCRLDDEGEGIHRRQFTLVRSANEVLATWAMPMETNANSLPDLYKRAVRCKKIDVTIQRHLRT